MLNKTTLQFLKNLKANNNKPWMDANQDAYKAAKQDWEQFVTQIIAGLAKHEPLLADILAKNCTFRQNRDVRFSKNKDPYKANFGASIKIGGKKSAFAGWYVHAEPDSNFIGGGFWMPEPDVTAKIRQEIDYNFAEFTKIVSNKKFKAAYTDGLGQEYRLVNVPKGYDATNPAANYLKLKSFTAIAPITNAQLLSKDAVKITLDALLALQPFIQFINRVIE
jgi:uncharacterized protein (TIGR02453 family)